MNILLIRNKFWRMGENVREQHEQQATRCVLLTTSTIGKKGIIMLTIYFWRFSTMNKLPKKRLLCLFKCRGRPGVKFGIFTLIFSKCYRTVIFFLNRPLESIDCRTFSVQYSILKILNNNLIVRITERSEHSFELNSDGDGGTTRTGGPYDCILSIFIRLD